MDRTKKILISLLVLGALAAIGTGTYATFNAQVGNSGNTFQTGTIFLSQTLNNAQSCISYGTLSGGTFSNGNSNTCANPLVAASNAVPGTPVAGGLIFENTGSLASTHFYANLSAACSSSIPSGSIAAGNGSLCSGSPTMVAALQEYTQGPVLGAAITASGGPFTTINIGGAGLGQAVPALTPLLLVTGVTGGNAGTATLVVFPTASVGAATTGVINVLPYSTGASQAFAITDHIYVPKASGCWLGDTETVGTVNANACTFDSTGTVAAVSNGDNLTSLYNTGAGRDLGALGTGVANARYFAFALGIPNTGTSAAQNSLQGLCLGPTNACAGLTATWTIQ